MKRFVVTLAVVVVVAVCGFLGFEKLGESTVANIEADYATIGDLKLDEVTDGVYRGTAGGFICSVTLDVTVKDHRITDISIIKQASGPDRKAPETVTRILDAQSARVDAVAGATWSSHAIMVATYRALQGR